MSTESSKKIVGYKAVDDYVKDGMTIGLGTGSTAKHAVDRIGQLLNDGRVKNIKCVCTSEETQSQAESLKLPLISINDVQKIDITIDGADEVDSNLNLIKGLGAALLREKLVEIITDKFIVIIDETKFREEGIRGPIPIEIIKFGYKHTINRVQKLIPKSQIKLRKNNNQDILETDNNNYIIDLYFDDKFIISDLSKLSNDLNNIIGVVEHGIFVNMVDLCLIAKNNSIILKNKK